jgi:hypothetical protein
MLRIKTIFLAALVLLGLECLNGVNCVSVQPIPVPLMVASSGDAGGTQINISEATAVDLVLEMYGVPTPTLDLNARISPRSVNFFQPLFKSVFTPKVSRYISKSVLNI